MKGKTSLKKRIAAFVTACAVAAPCCFVAQPANAAGEGFIKWTTMFGRNGGAGIETTDDSINAAERETTGEVIAAGAIDSKNIDPQPADIKGKNDAALILFASDGSITWEKYVGGTEADTFHGITVINSGGYIAVGSSKSNDGDFQDMNHGGYDATVVKFDYDGNVTAKATFGGSDKDEFNDVINTTDGGFLAIGYTSSADGTMEGIKTTEDQDALIVKYDKDLNVQWVKVYDGGAEGISYEKADEFESVIRSADGSFMCAGYANAKSEALAVRYGEDGNLIWGKQYGGSGDDVINAVSKASNNKTEIDKTNIDPSDIPGGFVFSGTSDSQDGIFEGKNTTGTDNAFIMKIDMNGEVQWLNTLENSVGATGETVFASGEGYMMAGTYEKADKDFTSQNCKGKSDMYIAHFAASGDLLGMQTAGGNDSDNVKGLIKGADDDYLIFGNTRSTSGDLAVKGGGRYDGFMMCMDKDTVENYAAEKYLVPVKAWKADADQPSMMADMLYKDAYVEKTGEVYQITAYFINAQIMGSQVSPAGLGAVSYDLNGTMTPALYDEYDSTTQVKTVTITATSLEEPIAIHIEDAMGDIRFAFDVSGMQETETPPYFAPVEVTQPEFANEWKTNIGGSDYDYTNDMAQLANGNTVVVGQTYSNDMDFKDMVKGASAAFVNIYNDKGELIKTNTLSGTEFDSVAYASSVAAFEDGSYIVTGGYTEGFGVEPTGDFKNLKTADSIHGETDGFIAKYDSNNELVWLKNLSGSQHDQIKQLKSLENGEYVILVETLSKDGDMTGLKTDWLYDLLVIKYDKNGKELWRKPLSGRNIDSASFGLDVMTDGDFIIGGHTSSGSGDFAGIEYYGDIFDVFAAKIDSETGEMLWIKSYGGDKNEYCKSVVATSDGGFALMGNTKSTTDTFAQTGTYYDNPFIIKCDSDGNEQWNHVIKSSEAGEATGLVELDDKYIVYGNSRGTDFDFKDKNHGSMDVFIAEYDKSGQMNSLDTLGGSMEEYAAKMLKINDYQMQLLMWGKSNDGDLQDINKGEFDGTLLTYNFAESPTDPTDPTDPTNPSNPENPAGESDTEKPDGAVNPTDTSGSPEDKTNSAKADYAVETGDENGDLLGVLAATMIGSAGMMYVVMRKKKYN